MTREITAKSQAWINAVASGKLTMGQRKLEALIKLEGDMAGVIAAAKSAGIHLLELTDDHGTILIAASKEPFKVLC